MSRHFSTDDISINPVYLSARSAIVTPERAIPVTLYALNKWLPRLGAERWALVQLLRGLCLDAPRRRDGTKRVTSSWKYLAECLQVHEETIASWLKHEKIPDDKPWRQIAPVDDYSTYLSLFVPRLRYAYETRNGKTRRVGFLLEVLMEDPIAPEDEIKLAQQVELLRYQQGQLRLESSADSQIASEINRVHSNLPRFIDPSVNDVTTADGDLQKRRHSNSKRLTRPLVNPDQSDSLPAVKQSYVDSEVDVISSYVDLDQGESDYIIANVNKLESLIEQLKQLKQYKRNYLQILEPIIALTEDLLNDSHSTAMLYKVLKVLFPNYMDLFIIAVEEALITHALDTSVNRGAVFVNTIRHLTSEANIDLGLRKSTAKNRISAEQAGFLQPVELSQSSISSLETPIEQAIWSETLTLLRGQLTKGMFDTYLQKTQLVMDNDGGYVIQVYSAQAKAWLDNRLRPIIERALVSVTGDAVQVTFQISGEGLD